MDAEPQDEAERSQVLQDTIRQISSFHGEEVSQCCVICLSDLAEPCQAQPCGHGDFDYLCLVTWLESQTTCPLCKSGVSEVLYDQNQNNEYEKVYKIPGRVRDKPRQQSELSPQHLTISASPSEDETIRRRRTIYRRNLYSLRVGSNKRQPAKSRYQELTPHIFATHPELVTRARIWLRRELRVFRFLYTEEHTNDQPTGGSSQHHVRRCRRVRAECLLEYIIAILKSMDMQGSTGQAEEMIRKFLGRDNTRLLLHELRAWLRSPCRSLEEWDRVVQYRDRDVMRQTARSEEGIRGNDVGLGQSTPPRPS